MSPLELCTMGVNGKGFGSIGIVHNGSEWKRFDPLGLCTMGMNGKGYDPL